MIDMTAYQQAAKRTATYAPADALAYLIPGLRCEVDEFTRTRVHSDAEKLEIGDVAWFTVMIMDTLNHSAVTMLNPTAYPPFALADASTAMLDVWVKAVRAGRAHYLTTQEVDSLLQRCHQMMAAIASFAAYRGWALADVLQANLDKLAQRYGEAAQ